MTSQDSKKNIIERVFIFFIKKLSNFFWDVADTWSYKSSTIARWYNNSIEKEYHKECSIYGLQKNLRVLHIGCGAYPLTEIVLAECCSGALVGIDKNPLAAQRAREVIQRHHLQNRVTIHQGNGIEYPISEFDLILISSCSLPKVQILEHLFNEAKHQTTIIVRELRMASADVLHCISEHPEIEMTKHMQHNPFPFYGLLGWDTFYLQKN